MPLTDEDDAFKPVGLAVGDDVAHGVDADVEHGALERVEEQRERLVEHPAKQDHRWDHKQGDLLGGVRASVSHKQHAASGYPSLDTYHKPHAPGPDHLRLSSSSTARDYLPND